MIATTTLFILLNAVREDKLSYNVKLEKIAEERCQNMKEWSHSGFPSDKIFKIKKNNFSYAGENLALGFDNAGSTMKALENSPTHYANNHDKNFTDIGIATCKNIIGEVSVFLFGGKKK